MTNEYAPPRNWDQFEELCADVFQSQFGDPALVRHGRGGQAQNGIDILARNGAVYPIGLQCKKKSKWPVRKLIKADVAAAIKEASKFNPALKEFYILTTAPDDADMQAHVATLNQTREAAGQFRIVVLGWDEIVRRATIDPVVMNKHFGPTGGNTPRSPLLAVWMMANGALEKTGRELELSVSELAQDLHDTPAGHFVIRQRESESIVESLKALERSGLSEVQRQRRIDLRERLRILTEREKRAVAGIRAMLADPDISPWLLRIRNPSDAHVSVAAYVQDHIGGDETVATGAQRWLRLYPPNDKDRRHRRSVRLTEPEAVSIIDAEQKFLERYKKPIIRCVMELPNSVQARAAIPCIVQGILEFGAADRLTEEAIRDLGAFDVGSWNYEQA